MLVRQKGILWRVSDDFPSMNRGNFRSICKRDGWFIESSLAAFFFLSLFLKGGKFS